MGEAEKREPTPEPVDVTFVGFELLEVIAAGRVIAVCRRGQPPVLRPNPFAPDDPRADEAERAFALLDQGADAARDEAAFQDAQEAFWVYLAQLPLVGERPVDAHGNATGMAWRFSAEPSGFAVYRAESPHDILPGAEALGPLGRAGYWGGSPEALLWLGHSREDLGTAVALVQAVDLASRGLAVYSAGEHRPLPGPVDAPPPGGLFELLLHLHRRGWWHPPGDELRVAIGGRWARAVAPCALCGAPTDPTPFGYAQIPACETCREHICDALLDRLLDLLRALLTRRQG